MSAVEPTIKLEEYRGALTRETLVKLIVEIDPTFQYVKNSMPRHILEELLISKRQVGEELKSQEDLVDRRKKDLDVWEAAVAAREAVTTATAGQLLGKRTRRGEENPPADDDDFNAIQKLLVGMKEEKRVLKARSNPPPDDRSNVLGRLAECDPAPRAVLPVYQQYPPQAVPSYEYPALQDAPVHRQPPPQAYVPGYYYPQPQAVLAHQQHLPLAVSSYDYDYTAPQAAPLHQQHAPVPAYHLPLHQQHPSASESIVGYFYPPPVPGYYCPAPVPLYYYPVLPPAPSQQQTPLQAVPEYYCPPQQAYAATGPQQLPPQARKPSSAVPARMTARQFS